MPELPEVEVLVRHLGPRLTGETIRAVQVHRARVIRPTSVGHLQKNLKGATFMNVTRRGKYLLFHLERNAHPILLIGHLGMTGRMYLQPRENSLAKHTAVDLELGKERFVFEDTRYFGRFTLDSGIIKALGPEPLSSEFTWESFAAGLKSSRLAVKIKLLDQSVVAGIGNIYASEALFRAGIAPTVAARRLSENQIQRLHAAIRQVLAAAVERGSTVPLDYSGRESRDALFYFGAAETTETFSEELNVYDRSGQPCHRCGAAIRRIVQAARSTYFCPNCQRRTRKGFRECTGPIFSKAEGSHSQR